MKFKVGDVVKVNDVPCKNGSTCGKRFAGRIGKVIQVSHHKYVVLDLEANTGSYGGIWNYEIEPFSIFTENDFEYI